MTNRLLKHVSILYSAIFLAVYIGVFASIAPADTLIKRETLSFQRCLGVIDTIAEQIALDPKIISDTVNVRKAEFSMTDGKLLVSCDKSKNEVRISSK